MIVNFYMGYSKICSKNMGNSKKMIDFNQKIYWRKKESNKGKKRSTSDLQAIYKRSTSDLQATTELDLK